MDILNFIENKLFEPKDSQKENKWHVINDFSIAEKYAYQQYDIETIWLDLREKKSLILEFSTDDDEFWDNIYSHIEEKILSVDLDVGLVNDIEADLYNCYLNFKYNVNCPFWSSIWDCYLSGLWPCGWLGKYPDGNLVAFCNPV